jgi:signal transduction histidine kinase
MMLYYNSLSEANATKDKLFKIISHDIRNPFSSLLSSSEMQLKFLQNRDYEKLEQTSQLINTSAKQIFELTQTLLDWSIAQTDSFKVKAEKLNINDLVEQVVTFCSIQAREKDIEIITNYGSPIYVELDNVMTQIAVRNILINAIKFSYRNSVIRVYVRQFNDFVNIEIVDKGIGMSKQKQQEIFSKAVVTAEYGTERERGSGLGIVISKELIEKQKGKISVESEEGKGSSFTLSFPLS